MRESAAAPAHTLPAPPPRQRRHLNAATRQVQNGTMSLGSPKGPPARASSSCGRDVEPFTREILGAEPDDMARAAPRREKKSLPIPPSLYASLPQPPPLYDTLLETATVRRTMAEIVLLLAAGSFGTLSAAYAAASPDAFGVPDAQ